jgi:hypothetical protein
VPSGGADGSDIFGNVACQDDVDFHFSMHSVAQADSY